MEEKRGFRGERGFTLIELLVVIAVIAILAAILFPVFLSAKRHSQQSHCLSNLKQLSLAVLQYTDDNDGRMPNVCGYLYPHFSPDWCGCQGTRNRVKPEKGSIWRYVKKRELFLCPLDRRRNAEHIAEDADPKNYALSYSMNGELHLIKLDSIRGRPSKVMLLIHESRKTINDGLYLWKGNDWDTPDDVHYDGTTLSYCDGHVRWAKSTVLLKECMDGYWDPKGVYK